MNNKKYSFTTYLLSVFLVFSQVIAPVSVFAQSDESPVVSSEPAQVEAPTTEPESVPIVLTNEEILVETVTIEDSVSSSDTPSNPDASNLLPEIVSPQDTASEQITAGGDLIEDTASPQSGGGIPSSVATDTSTFTPATSTPPIIIDVVGDQTPEVVPQNSEDVIEIDAPETVSIVTEMVTQVVATEPIRQFTTDELVPEKKYTFTVESNAIATKSIPDWSSDNTKKKQQAGQVYAVPTFINDTETGSLTVTGSCLDPYFVVLIYKKAQDYNKDPSSYVFNKAFECINGTYSYELNELPESVRKGRYYLLIGGQGDSGSWKPITALSPMNIEKELDSDE